MANFQRACLEWWRRIRFMDGQHQPKRRHQDWFAAQPGFRSMAAAAYSHH